MDPIWSYLFKPTKTKEESQLECLEQTALFDGMPRKKMKKILRILHEREYAPEETIFRVGEPGVGMYIILEGEVAVNAISPQGEERVVAVLKQGQTIGDLALIEDALRTATVIATQQTRLLGLIRPELMDLIKRDPALGCDLLMRLLKVLGQRLLNTNELLAEAMMQLEVAESEARDDQELQALVGGDHQLKSRTNLPAAGKSPDKNDKSSKTNDKSDKSDKPDKPDKSDKSDKSDKTDKATKSSDKGKRASGGKGEPKA